MKRIKGEARNGSRARYKVTQRCCSEVTQLPGYMLALPFTRLTMGISDFYQTWKAGHWAEEFTGITSKDLPDCFLLLFLLGTDCSFRVLGKEGLTRSLLWPPLRSCGGWEEPKDQTLIHAPALLFKQVTESL
jgi:hypothetical protein